MRRCIRIISVILSLTFGAAAIAQETVGSSSGAPGRPEAPEISNMPVQAIPLAKIQNQRFPEKPATLMMGIGGSGQLVNLFYDGFDQNSAEHKQWINLGKLAETSKSLMPQEPGPGKVLFHYDGWGIHLDTMVLSGKFDQKNQVLHLNIRYAYDSRTPLLSGGNTPIFRNCAFDVKPNAQGTWALARRTTKADPLMVSSTYGVETILGLCGMTAPNSAPATLQGPASGASQSLRPPEAPVL